MSKDTHNIPIAERLVAIEITLKLIQRSIDDLNKNTISRFNYTLLVKFLSGSVLILSAWLSTLTYLFFRR